MNHAPSPRCLPFIAVLIACLRVLPAMHSVVPSLDGCYPNYTTAEGCKALNFLTAGAGNTAVGWYSLFSNTDASFNTGVRRGALASTTETSIRQWARQHFCSIAPVIKTPPLEPTRWYITTAGTQTRPMERSPFSPIRMVMTIPRSVTPALQQHHRQL
jgi:hypothetical protein